VGGALFFAFLGGAVPLGTGYWDPAWLRVAQSLQVDLSAAEVGVGQALAPFSVEQRALDGSFRWTLTGDGVRAEGGSLQVQAITQPRVWLRHADGFELRASARGGRLHLPGEGSPAVARLELAGEVVLTGAGRAQGAPVETRLETSRLELWVRRDGAGIRAPGGARVRCAEPVSVTLAQGGVRWTVEAPQARGGLVPLALDLGGPVRFATTAPVASLTAPLQGVARGGLRLAGPPVASPVPDGEPLWPPTIELTATGVEAATTDGLSRLACARLVADLERVALAGAREDEGGLGEAPRFRAAASRWEALELEWVTVDRRSLRLVAPRAEHEEAEGRARAAAEGGVTLALGLPGRGTWDGEAARVAAEWELPAAGPPGLRQLERLEVRAAPGREARLAARGGPERVRLRELDYVAEGAVARLALRRGFEATLEGVEGGRRPAPYRARGASLAVRFDRAALAAADEPGLEWWRRALIDGRWTRASLRRLGPAGEEERRRGLTADELRYDAPRLKARGAPARVVLGASTLAAPELDYHVEEGRLVARGGLVYAGRFRRPSSGAEPDRREPAAVDEAPFTVEVRAPQGEARLAPDPAAWERHQAARRQARAGDGGFLLPRPLESLELEGSAAARVVVVGSDGLRAEADRASYRWDLGRAVLHATPGGPPVQATWSGRGVSAGRLEVTRLQPAGPRGPQPLWISAEGGVVAEGAFSGGSASGGEEPAQSPGAGRLRAEWFFCELVERPGGDPPLELGRYGAGGAAGTRLAFRRPGDSAEELQQAVLLAPRLRGDGQAQLEGGGRGVSLELPAWEADIALPRRGPGRARGGSLRALFDPRTLEGAGWDPEQPALATFQRALRRFEVAGGVDLAAQGLQVRGETATFDGVEGSYVLEGAPSVVQRDGFTQRARVQRVDLLAE
jgi:hypothetical protein